MLDILYFVAGLFLSGEERRRFLQHYLDPAGSPGSGQSSLPASEREDA